MKYYFLCICLFFSFFIMAKPSVSGSSAGQLVDRTLAVVEGEMISLLDLKEAQRRFRAGFFNGFALVEVFGKSRLKADKAIFLDMLIAQKLLEIAAKDNGIVVEENQIRQELNKIREQKGLSKKKFSRWLVKQGWTADSYKMFVQKSILRQMLIQRDIVQKIRVSDQDLNSYAFQKQGRPLFSSFKYDLAYLLFPGTVEGQKEAIRVSGLMAQDPVYFDKWQARSKGEKKEELKNIALSALSPNIRGAIKDLAVGQVSPVLRLPNGYHIFKALWKTPVISAQNERRKAKLSALLFADLFKQGLKAWIERQKKDSFVQVYLSSHS